MREEKKEKVASQDLTSLVKLFLLCVAGVPLVTRVTLSCLMENVFLTVRTYASFDPCKHDGGCGARVTVVFCPVFTPAAALWLYQTQPTFCSSFCRQEAPGVITEAW